MFRYFENHDSWQKEADEMNTLTLGFIMSAEFQDRYSNFNSRQHSLFGPRIKDILDYAPNILGDETNYLDFNFDSMPPDAPATWHSMPDLPQYLARTFTSHFYAKRIFANNPLLFFNMLNNFFEQTLPVLILEMNTLYNVHMLSLDPTQDSTQTTHAQGNDGVHSNKTTNDGNSITGVTSTPQNALDFSILNGVKLFQDDTANDGGDGTGTNHEIATQNVTPKPTTAYNFDYADNVTGTDNTTNQQAVTSQDKDSTQDTQAQSSAHQNQPFTPDQVVNYLGLRKQLTDAWINEAETYNLFSNIIL